MKRVTREEQNKIKQQFDSPAKGGSQKETFDNLYDGVDIPREISVNNWLYEEEVHETKILSNQIDSTRYFLGPQVTILRDDNRRTTWAAYVENSKLFLNKIKNERVEKILIAEGKIWRYHIALNKFSGKVSTVYVTKEKDKSALWIDGKPIETEALDIDFPFFSFSQVTVGHVAKNDSPFAFLSYKCRAKGQIYVRRYVKGQYLPETKLELGETVGGLSFGIFKKKIIGRVDLKKNDSFLPALIESSDEGNSFSKPQLLNLEHYLPIEKTKDKKSSLTKTPQGFDLLLSYSEPIVDKGGSFNIPILIGDGKRTIALNYNLDNQLLVEAISIRDLSTKPKRLGRGGVEVFPSTVGSMNSFGNGISDGHGLIMVLADEKGYLFTSNSSAGGSYFPEKRLLNHEMPLLAAFSSSECYSNGQMPNIVSMDYLYIEANEEGEPFSNRLHFETWHMPLPIPVAKAKSKKKNVEVKILSDADLEPGKVIFNFDDPKIQIVNAFVNSLRTAVIETDSENLKGKLLTYDVLTLFHRHFGEVIVE